jgi:hypothetical protein
MLLLSWFYNLGYHSNLNQRDCSDICSGSVRKIKPLIGYSRKSNRCVNIFYLKKINRGDKIRETHFRIQGRGIVFSEEVSCLPLSGNKESLIRMRQQQKKEATLLGGLSFYKRKKKNFSLLLQFYELLFVYQNLLLNAVLAILQNNRINACCYWFKINNLVK